ncbi:putative membrane protein YqjE [Cytobacillus eiseniae]|uniref:Membrane protein YqjE n=1 Tax=Cytobacillus eiseniae TaxID=762947 RepID=A0ABS4RGJ1_9BACI|nr:DUF5658 family protein [Cytobacillus eiseniae]MBP2241849.1 putative membrane protein YqjE [Cytobacillus eiseniae]
MNKIVAYLALLNVADGTLTFFGLQYSLMEESNPLMNHLYAFSPLLFLGYKFLLSGVLCLLVLTNKFPTYRFVKAMLVTAAAIYSVVIAIHAMWIIPIIV